MSKYRILEKKGTREKIPEGVLRPAGKVAFPDGTYYIPRFIVQEESTSTNFFPSGKVSRIAGYKDLKEFTSLEEARAYKRELELEEGIVRE
jgi:hypothetical protein